MRATVLLDTLQNLIGFKPKAKDFVKILELNSEKTFYARVQRDSDFSDDEIERLERVYAIKIPREEPSDCIELDFYPNVFGSCGNGLTIFDESSEKITITKDIIDGYSTAYSYSVISARGSSMSPVINDDDKLVVQMHNGEQIIDNSIYIFRYNDELFIKRLVKNIDQIVCISENPRFDDRIIDPAKCEFSIIGKIVGLFRSKV